MRKLSIILLFISSFASGQLVQRGTNEVWIGGRESITESGGFSDYYYFLNNTETAIFSRGPVAKGIFYFATLPTDSLMFEVWRSNGVTYDRVYKENILSKLTAAVVDTVTFATAIDAREGDKIAIKMSGGGSLGAVDLGVANSLYYAAADTILESTGVDFSTRFPNSLGYALSIKLLGRSPEAVIIGNSIAAGHPANYSGVEASIASYPDSAISGALFNLDTSWVVQNMATGSTTSSYLNTNFTNYVKNIYPKYTIIESGVNDIATSVPKATYINNMIQFMDSLQANSIIPIVIKIPPWSNGTNTQMQTRDDWMTDISDSITSRYPEGFFIDVDTALGQFRSGGDPGNLWDGQSAYYADGVHPNGLGYIKIASIINTVVNTTNVYYVATDGNDSNPGTLASPWLTWQKAFDSADAGDTVYFRGGVYYSTSPNVIDPENINGGGVHGNNGTSANKIYFIGYPGETPILDCINHCDPYTGYNQGILLVQVEHLVFKDLTVRNVFLCADNQVSGAIASDRTANIRFERVKIYQVEGRGFHWLSPGAWTALDGAGSPFASDSSYWINCDVYAICDTSVTNPGNAGDAWKCHTYYGNYYYWEGCRAWQYSDDGFDMSGQGERVFKNCWAMPTGTYDVFDIEANGFKAGAVNPLYVPSGGHGDTFLHYENCLAMFGNGANSGGFYDLDYDPYQMTKGVYWNNTAYGMVYGFRSNTPTDSVETGVWRNNLSYNNTLQSVIDAATSIYIESNNTWDASTSAYPWYTDASDVTVTDADFVTVDSATLVSLFTASRQADGSLPLVKPLSLVAGSDLIDAGVDVGLSYLGSAPEIGYFEYTPAAPAVAVKKIYTINGVKQIYWDGPTPYIITVDE